MPRRKSEQMTPLELEILHVLWDKGPANAQTIQKELKRDLAYTTVQTMIYRLEEKGAVRRVKKIGNAHLFEAIVTRKAVHRRLIGDLLDFFGGSPAPVVSHLIETGKLTLADVQAIEETLGELEKKQ